MSYASDCRRSNRADCSFSTVFRGLGELVTKGTAIFDSVTMIPAYSGFRSGARGGPSGTFGSFYSVKISASEQSSFAPKWEPKLK
jgi:hypothetical protein